MTEDKFVELVANVQAHFARLSPEEQAAERQAQRESWVRGEMKIGNDRDEAKARQEYRDQLAADEEAAQ